MRDDDDGTLAAQPCDRREHPLLRAAVEGAGRLVEEEHRQARRERATDRDPLALSARHGAIGDEDRIADGRDETACAELVEDARRVSVVVLVLVLVARAEYDVRDERVAEDRCILRDPGERSLLRPHAAPGEVLVTPRDRALAWRLETEQRAEERRLADPGRADDGRDPPGRENERQRLVRAMLADEPLHGERREGPRPLGAWLTSLAHARSGGPFACLLESVLGASAYQPAVDELAERLVRHEERNRERHDRAALDAADRASSHHREREHEGKRSEHLARVRDERRARPQS